MLGSLFFIFFKIGAVTFGGGYAMISLIRQEVIERKKWIQQEEFLDLLALALSAPGPIALNTAVFIGYKVKGYRGALSALLGAVLPSFLIILAIALFFREIRQEPLVEAAFRGMRPAVVALILYPVITLARGIHPWAIPVVILSALAIWWLGLSPILLIILGAIGGITLHFINLKRGTKQ